MACNKSQHKYYREVGCPLCPACNTDLNDDNKETDMTLDKIQVDIFTDDDGHQIRIKNRSNNATRTWRADYISNRPNHFLFYDLHKKPNTRSHQFVELPGPVADLAVFDEWVDEQLENMAQGVM